MLSPTRGIRNNNPGNIRRVAGVEWAGAKADQSGDPSFVVFTGPEFGIRAMARTLLSYKRRGVVTIAAIITRWAPASENATGAYIDAVAREMNRAPDSAVDIENRDDARSLIAAIIRHENGNQPYALATIDHGLELAGLLPPSTPET